jgi:hypothetical protein
MNMKLKSPIVSLLIGTIIGATAVLSIAATSTDSSFNGRFQLLAADTYLFKIDTATGQVWRTWTSSPSKDFMAPNIGRTNAPAPNLEKNSEK